MNALLQDALAYARQNPANDVWKTAAIYLAGQLEIALHHTSAGYGRLPPQKPIRAPKPKPESVD